MTPRHYDSVAAILAAARPKDGEALVTWLEMVFKLSLVFKHENPAFMLKTFWDACHESVEP